MCGADSFSVEASGYDYEYRTANEKFYFVRCDKCGHVYLNPRPVSGALKKIYPENYYTKTGRHSGARIALVKRFVIRRRLSFFKQVFKTAGAILELGCGDCSLIKDIKNRYPKCSVTGVDLFVPPHIVIQCQMMGIDIIEADAETLSFQENTYDLIIMNQLIEHLRFPDQLLDKTFKALKPGGTISIETPNLDGYDRKIFRQSFWGGYYFPRHMNLFSTETINRLLAAKGLKVVKQISLVAPIIWIFSLSAAINSRFPVLRKHTIILSDSDTFTLGLFSAIDMVALILGETTSNQKIVAQKPTNNNDGA